jgi:hypothetical protein
VSVLKIWVSRLALAALMGGAFGLVAPGLGQAQPPAVSSAASPAAFGAAERHQALAAIIARIQRGYVHMDQRAAIIGRLRDSDRRGRFDTAGAIEFAQRITGDFDAVTHDSHLYLRYEPDWYAAALAPTDPGDTEKENTFEQEITRKTNHGLIEMKILPGNIRYLRIDGFDWIEGETNIAYDGALRFLKGGDAIIIDLRGNTGGWTQSAKYLISHFLDADTLYATWRFADGTQEQQRTADYLPAGRIKGVPVLILIDHQSRSAAEQVAYSLQQFKVAELVGATSAGASYTTDDTAIAPGFRLSVSISEDVDAITHTSWEAVGVKPTFDVDPGAALGVAELRAIDQMLPAAKDGRRDELLWARTGYAAATAPVSPDATALGGMAGCYGAAALVLRGDTLWLRRPTRDYRLSPMTRGGLFQAVDVESLRVRVTGRTLEILRADPKFNQTFPASPGEAGAGVCR